MKKNNENTDDSKGSLIEGDEIDLKEVIIAIWASRKKIYITTFLFFVIGVIVAFSSRVEYETSCHILPNVEEGQMPNLGGLGSLAGLAGINFEMGKNENLNPELYPQIVQSLPFQLKLINEKINFQKLDTTISSYIYFKEIDNPTLFENLFSYTFGLWSKIKNMATPIDSINLQHDNNTDIIFLSKADHEIIKRFKRRVSVTVNPETHIISLTTKMPDKMATAELTKTFVNLLQDKIINYKINKASENLNFIKERFNEANIKFEKAQYNLATYNDRNLNVVTSRYQSEQQRLQNEYDLAFEVYKELATQQEKAEIKVKENTPVFTIIEPIQVPVEKSGLSKKVVIAIFTFFGIVVGFVGVFLISFIKNQV